VLSTKFQSCLVCFRGYLLLISIKEHVKSLRQCQKGKGEKRKKSGPEMTKSKNSPNQSSRRVSSFFGLLLCYSNFIVHKTIEASPFTINS
jgi:hypothetical protein